MVIIVKMLRYNKNYSYMAVEMEQVIRPKNISHSLEAVKIDEHRDGSQTKKSAFRAIIGGKCCKTNLRKPIDGHE